ncbi:transcription elongation factor SPT5 [Marchantia polymorpha subsp. ruderalis]|uniref:Transcription elongation factor SPT5 n=2 Tax=Marchantia polymorpha TaxID=3197 RepID=A0AAF6BF57_MARPO|nr:hypothetical protein MARPO_0027s0102 [Marchantia polymorpha]BBN10641.1 hypothetical protein Mp_5g05240 [Marchantia polymorpha subsp. ruderalis]|eukprot:PTQ42993.1 hypothetical protein MARPO_0027s0102 [Marchantia polymorpha]
MGYKNYSDEEEEDDDVEEEEAEDVEDEEEEVEEEDEEEEEERSRKRKFKGSQFIDDVAEEDDDEDEEEEEAPRKRRHRRASEFIDDTAAVASDDDEEEMEGEEDFIHDEGPDLADEEDRGRKHHRAMLPEDDQQENVEDLEKFIQQRYGRQEYEEFDEAETTDVEQQALLPSVRDPKLWMVKCQIGHEREASICLMQKFMDMDMQGKPLLIKSAIALDHLKGYLYVESEKEAYVRESIRGMRMILQREVKLVPIKEMTDVLSVEKKSVDIDQDTWVRVKNGVYKGDLAKVVDVDHVRQRATIKLIPRVDLQALALKMNEGSIKGSKDDAKNRPRPAPRFINVQELQDLKISIERKRDPNHAGEYFEFFGGMQFKDGYLYKGVSLKSIDSNGVVPSFDELQKFQKPTDEGGPDTMGLPTALMSKRKGLFVKGDAVIVVQGDLKNLMGYVEKVDDDDVFVRPKDKELKGSTLAFKDRQLCKFFKTGDHVKVVAGTHEGATGMIVRVDLGSVVILSDTTKEDIKVFTANIVESSEVTSGLNKLGDYELHDLVLLDQSTVGVIVRVEKDSCQVLKGTPERAEVVTVKLRDMRKKLFDRNTNAQDRDSNVVSLKDIVRVVEGPFKGREGPVEHINRGILFIHDRHHLENGGFLCVRGLWCVALGGSRNGIDRGGRQARNNNFNGGFQAPANYLQSPRRTPNHFNHPGGGGGHGGSTFGGRQAGRRRDHGLVGTTVKIRIGPFKGYRGRVVDATDIDVRIELESQMKVVTVRRDQLSDPVGTPYHNGGGASYRESPRYGAGSETPMHPSRTPMHPAFMTPMRDPSATPIHDGMRTPMRDRAWNPHTAMNTPLRDNSWDDANPSTWGHSGTPQYQPGTPGGRQYEAPTPGGGGWANTPGASFSEAGTPSVSTGPSYGNPASPYLPGTPGGPPMTPGVPSYLPSTPGGQPMTPGTGGLDPTSPASGLSGLEIESKWGLPEIVVTVRKAGEESQIGVIHEAMPDGTCRVAMGPSGEGEIIVATHSELELVVPKKTDRIKIVSGELRRSTGKLIGIDGADGIVKMDDTLDIKILDMSSLGKMVAN